MIESPVIELNDRIHDRVIELLRPVARGKLLDVGAGDGTLASRLRTEGFQVSAVDLITRDFQPRDIEIRVGNLNSGIPYADGEFDAAVATEVIEHLENPWMFIRELHRITRPGGTVVISTPNMDSVFVRAWFALTGRLYNFMEASYRSIGHISPIYLWNLKRMIEGKFELEAVTVNASPIPKIGFRLPTRSLLFGQCIVVKLRRLAGAPIGEGRTWTDSRIVRG